MTTHKRLSRSMRNPARQARRAKKRASAERAREYLATIQPGSELRGLFASLKVSK